MTFQIIFLYRLEICNCYICAGAGTMDATNQAAWENLTPEEKRRALYDRQVAPLKTFHEHGVITQAQHDKSLHDLTEKMGYADE